MPEPIKIIVLSTVSVVYLFLLTKMMGNKQISQMNMFDYIIGISIGSIAAEMAVNIEDNPLHSLIAMAVYALLALCFSLLTNGSVFWRKIITGRTILLFDQGTFYKDNFSKARTDINDFLSMLRVKGYFNLSEIETVILEPNGTVSILPKSEHRPATPNDMSICPSAEKLVTNVIVDGHILSVNLSNAGYNEAWLQNQLKAQGVSDISHVFLATVDYNGDLSVYKTTDKNKNPNPFD